MSAFLEQIDFVLLALMYVDLSSCLAVWTITFLLMVVCIAAIQPVLCALV